MRVLALLAIIGAILYFEVSLPFAVQFSDPAPVYTKGVRVELQKGALVCHDSKSASRVMSLVGQYDGDAASKELRRSKCTISKGSSTVVFESSHGLYVRRVRFVGEPSAIFVNAGALRSMQRAGRPNG